MIQPQPSAAGALAHRVLPIEPLEEQKMSGKSPVPAPHGLTLDDLYASPNGLSNKMALSHYVRVIHVLLPIYEAIGKEVEALSEEKKLEKNLANVVLHSLRAVVRGASCQVTKFSESYSSKNLAMYISDEAIKELKKAEPKIKRWPRKWPTGFVAEHVIPVTVLCENIISRTQAGGPMTEENLTDFFLAYSHTAVITKGEDDKLRKSKSLHQSMPESFNDLNKCSERNIFARYLKLKHPIPLKTRESEGAETLFE